MLKSIPFYSSLLNKPLSSKKNATHSHVLVYGAIEAHAHGELGCIASNATLAAETGMTEGTIANCLSALAKAGWIKVTSKQGKHSARDQIIPLLEVAIPTFPKKEVSPQDEGVSSPDETGLTPRLNRFHPQMNIDSSIDNILDNSLEKTTGAKNLPPYGGSDEKKIFDTLYQINKAIPFNRKNQWEAARWLVIQLGGDRAVKMAEAAVAAHGQPYAPMIATPVQLKDKLAALEHFYVRTQSRQESKKILSI